MKRIIYKIIAFIHNLTVKSCLIRSEEESGVVKLHTICGRWMGAVQYEGYRFDDETKKLVDLEDPSWVALVFPPNGPTVKERCASAEEAAALLPQLVRQHLGRRFIFPREWWAT